MTDMTDPNEYDFQRYERIITTIIQDGCEFDEDPECLSVGENCSGLPEIKVIFDGFADKEIEDDDGNYVETIEQGNTNSRSYAVFIDHRSGQDGFEFPEHEMHPFALIHRPKQEVCIYVWHDVEADTWDVLPLEDRIDSDSPFTPAQIMEVLEKIWENNFSWKDDEEEAVKFPTTRPSPSLNATAAWPFATATPVDTTYKLDDEEDEEEKPKVVAQDWHGILTRVVEKHGLPTQMGAKGWISETQNFHYKGSPIATAEDGLKGWLYVEQDDDGDGNPSWSNVDELAEVARAMIEDNNDGETYLDVSDTRSVEIHNDEADGKSWDFEIDMDEDEFWEIVKSVLIENGELDEPEEDEEIDNDDLDVNGFLWSYCDDMGGEQRYSYGYGVAYMEFADGFRMGMTIKNGDLYVHYYDGKDVTSDTVFE